MPEPQWLATDEALRFWQACPPVGECDVASEWLKARGLDPDAIELWNLARRIPPGPLPTWARCGQRDWRASGHRVIIPTFSAFGVLQGFRARSTRAEVKFKELAPAGVSSSGLVLACPLAQQFLATSGAPAWWASGRTPGIQVAEGVPDFLSLASRTSEERVYAAAVIGIGSGAWGPAIASRIPSGARIVLCPHDDLAGHAMAQAVGDSLRARCNVTVFSSGSSAS